MRNFYATVFAVQFFMTLVSSPAGADSGAVSAYTFLGSLGIITHVDQGVSGGSYVLPLRYLGVRNIRDGQRNLSQMLLINRLTGARFDLFIEGDLDAAIPTAKTLAASGALMAVEGPNEPNNFPINYKAKSGGGMGTWAPVAQMQQAIYRAIKLGFRSAKIPSLCGLRGGSGDRQCWIAVPDDSNWSRSDRPRWDRIRRLRQHAQLCFRQRKNVRRQ